ncbi:hypothetical protein FOA43_003950 [Brettanomyces nanus]|uniref:Uncharacterized protein n=1 Tax=Eeniella nana TaxID=13502 RepID=A0A875RQD0_EENNA|nr:uncharacterized protein FOA43_003950 [Brettanomyces nanus]QPG76560.1 hypothetical protein FOA43_003950 [Brettanomyces nanus]
MEKGTTTPGHMNDLEENSMHDFASMHKDLLVSVSLIGCFVLILLVFAVFFYRSYKDYQSSLASQKSELHGDEEEGQPFPFQETSSRSLISIKAPVNEVSLLPVSQQEEKPVVCYDRAAAQDDGPEKQRKQTTEEGTRPNAFRRSNVGSLQNLLRRLQSVRLSRLGSTRQAAKTSTSAVLSASLTSILQEDNYSPIKIVEKTSSSEGTYNIPTAKTQREIMFIDNTVRETIHGPPKKVYEIDVLMELGSLERIKSLQSQADRGDILLSEALLPKMPIELAERLTASDITLDLIDIKKQLQYYSDDNTMILIELMRFFSHTFGMQKYQNARIFMAGYADLVKYIVGHGIVPKMFYHSSLLGTFLIEQLIKYCTACWKHDITTHRILDSQFTEWDMEQMVPSKVEVYGYLLNLLQTGLRSDILLDILTHFTPCASLNVLPLLYQKEKESTKPETRSAFQHLIEIATSSAKKTLSIDRSHLRSNPSLGNSLKMKSLPGSLSKRSPHNGI